MVVGLDILQSGYGTLVLGLKITLVFLAQNLSGLDQVSLADVIGLHEALVFKGEGNLVHCFHITVGAHRAGNVPVGRRGGQVTVATGSGRVIAPDKKAGENGDHHHNQ